MNSTSKAQLEGNIEHLTAGQTALFNTLNQKQQAAFLVEFPAPVAKTGPLYPVFTFKGEKVLGIPTWKLAKSFIGGGDMADIIDAQSVAIKAGTKTTAEANADWGMVLVHSDDTDLDVGDLDVAAARKAREDRDAAYRATHPKQGNGIAQVFTAQMP